MTSLLSRLAVVLAAFAAFATGTSAWALTVTDGVTTKTTCTSFTYDTNSNTINLTPSNCLTSAPAGGGPTFSLRMVPTSITQSSSTEVRTAEVFVDVTGTASGTYNLTLNLCLPTAPHNCTSASSGNWYFNRYAELGGPTMTPQDGVTTGSFDFTFQPGIHTSPTNLQSMGIGRINVPYSPAFSGNRAVMFSLSGTGANSNPITYTITGSQPSQPVSGDYDISGALIQTPSGPFGARLWCQSSISGTPTPGSGPGPCGAYQIAVPNNCSSGMTGANEITKAWMYALEDFNSFPYLRAGQNWQVALPRDQAMIWRFKTGPASSFAFPAAGYIPVQFNYDENANYGSTAAAFITLSESKCDFDYSKTTAAGASNACYMTSGYTGTLFARLYPTSQLPAPTSYCPLKPDTTYYINIRYENASSINTRGTISCPNNQCGQIFGLQ